MLKKKNISFDVGDCVAAGSVIGIVKYFGVVTELKAILYGIEASEQVSQVNFQEHDLPELCEKYFRCEKGKGILRRADEIKYVSPEELLRKVTVLKESLNTLADVLEDNKIPDEKWRHTMIHIKETEDQVPPLLPSKSTSALKQLSNSNRHARTATPFGGGPSSGSSSISMPNINNSKMESVLTPFGTSPQQAPPIIRAKSTPSSVERGIQLGGGSLLPDLSEHHRVEAGYQSVSSAFSPFAFNPKGAKPKGRGPKIGHMRTPTPFS